MKSKPRVRCIDCKRLHAGYWYAPCSRCAFERLAKWRKEHPVEYRCKVRGWPLAHYYAQEKKQRGRCAICEKRARLKLDHDHKNNKPRALLCLTCNLGLGHFHDNPRTIRNALRYLMKWTVKRRRL